MNPIRHGDWHLINGELVDISQSPINTPDTPQAVTGSDVDGDPPISLPPITPAKRRNKTHSED